MGHRMGHGHGCGHSYFKVLIEVQVFGEKNNSKMSCASKKNLRILGCEKECEIFPKRSVASANNFGSRIALIISRAQLHGIENLKLNKDDSNPIYNCVVYTWMSSYNLCYDHLLTCEFQF